jgi:hypothetical protein
VGLQHGRFGVICFGKSSKGRANDDFGILCIPLNLGRVSDEYNILNTVGSFVPS